MPVLLAAVSGGPDSVYLLKKLVASKSHRIIVAHVNYGMRGRDSRKDQALVENIAKSIGLEKHIFVVEDEAVQGKTRRPPGLFPAGFERKARDIRYRFLAELARKTGAEKIALAHTADDQVETILMRVFEGAGIGGLKGIPRETADGIDRPILDVWKEDILKYLKKWKISYRSDRSNADTRFERNWIRHVLIPILEKRYGKGIKNRIFELGERFREVDEYLEREAARWIRKHVTVTRESTKGNVEGNAGDLASPGEAHQRKSRPGIRIQRRTPCGIDGAFRSPDAPTSGFRRKSFSCLPSALRMKILQRICFDRLGIAPNERLLKAMDRNVCIGGPSSKVKAGRGWTLGNRYGEALFGSSGSGTGRGRRSIRTPGTVPADGKGLDTGGPGRRKSLSASVLLKGPGEYDIRFAGVGPVRIGWRDRGRVSPSTAKRIACGGDAEVFDAAALATPLAVRPLRAGDRIRPFGQNAEGSARTKGGNGGGAGKRVKEILIDRKVPRDERWGRPVICDAEGGILWIPGVVRSSTAPVTARTKKAVLLEVSRSRK